MNTQDLHDGWTLTAVAGPVPADLAGRRVRARRPRHRATPSCSPPGSSPIRTRPPRGGARLAAPHRLGVRARPDLAPAAPDERVDLVFDGLDTVAT